MQKETCLRRAGKTLLPLWLLAAFLGVMLEARAQTPPANDNLTNAQAILGLQGTVTGNNQYATLQTGEPAPVAGVQSGASIWYKWAAPMAGYMDFDTHNSTVASISLGTVMAVYRLPSSASPLVSGQPDQSGRQPAGSQHQFLARGQPR